MATNPISPKMRLGLMAGMRMPNVASRLSHLFYTEEE